jgi:acetyl esterase/lipase
MALVSKKDSFTQKDSFTMSNTSFTPIFIPDVCYGTTDEGKPLLLDIMRPEPPPENRMPVVVQIHGGGWQAGSKDGEQNRFFAEQGFFTISIDYRLSSEATFPTQIEDVKMAVRWVHEHAEMYHLDAQRIGVWGHSAGGHLAALLGTSGDRQTPEDKPVVERYSVQVQAVATLAGPADLLRMGEWNPDPNSCESQLLGGPVVERVELARNASPVAFVNRAMPPFLIIHGMQDDVVPFQQAALLHDALKAVDADVTFVPVAGGHGLREDWRIDVREVLAFFQTQLCGMV